MSQLYVFTFYDGSFSLDIIAEEPFFHFCGMAARQTKTLEVIP